jgi:hypothetical protein
VFDSPVKDPRKVAAGRAGARARWLGERRVVRLDSLHPSVAAAVRALVAADAAAKASPDPAPESA